MASPWHKSDYPKMPNEAQVMDALRPLNIAPGDYFFPRPASTADMKSPEHAEKMRQGPVVVMTVFPNGMGGMGRNLGLWFAYSLAVGVFTAFVTGRALPLVAEPHRLFHIAILTAFSGYTLALWQMWIWYRRSLVTTLKATVDGVIYAAITAGIFVWLWP
jgi:hypothetical protein